MNSGIRNEHAAKLMLSSPKGIIFTEGKSGRLNLPGGGIEEGECFMDALERELDEELGFPVSELGHMAWLGTYSFRLMAQTGPINRIWHVAVAETDFLPEELPYGAEVVGVHALTRERVYGHSDVTKSAKVVVAKAHTLANELQRQLPRQRVRQMAKV